MNKFRRLNRLQSETQDEGGTDVIEVAPEDQADSEQPEPELVPAGDGQSDDGGEAAPPEEDDLVVTIEGATDPEEEEASAPSWVKELRRKNREDQKRLRELEAENQRLKGGTQVAQAPKKPKLEDFDYDADAFEKAMDSYYADKAKHDAELEKQAKAQEEQQKEWQERQSAYIETKKRFKPEAMKEAEDEVVSTLPPARQAMIIDVADDPGTIVYALGKNPAKLRELAAIKSDGRFIKELAKLEMNIKVQPKAKTPPPPERTITGAGRTPGSAAANLEKLKAEAQSSGDYSKYLAEKRRLGK
jgi:hypothetical protein